MIRKAIRFTVCSMAVAMAVSTTAKASVVYDNGVPDYYYALGSDVNSSDESADSFVLPTGVDAISDAHWWGFYAPGSAPASDDFTIRIFADASGVPDTSALYEIAVSDAHRTVDAGHSISGHTGYAYSADFSPITLTAGTTYWFSVQNDTTSDTGENWYWLTANGTGSAEYLSSGGSWTETHHDFAFNLTNDGVTSGAVVPEPASLTLLGMGLVGFAGRRFRKRA